MPFFSPDSRWVAFVSVGRLWKVPVEGGEPTDLAPIENFFGGAWGPDGTIVYAPEPGGAGIGGEVVGWDGDSELNMPATESLTLARRAGVSEQVIRPAVFRECLS